MIYEAILLGAVLSAYKGRINGENTVSICQEKMAVPYTLMSEAV